MAHQWPPTEQEEVLEQLCRGATYAQLAPRYDTNPSSLRRQVLGWCAERNPELCRWLGWPITLHELRSHPVEFIGRYVPRDGPLVGRNEAIVERFAAGESYKDLAYDYGLTMERIAQILHRFSQQADPAKHSRLLPPGRGKKRIPPWQLRPHLRTLLDREVGCV